MANNTINNFETLDNHALEQVVGGSGWGMADRERKEQEAWDREKKRRGKEYESDKQERRDRER
mgnify:CR=1 FL=1